MTSNPPVPQTLATPTEDDAPGATPSGRAARPGRLTRWDRSAAKARKGVSSPAASVMAIVIAVLWTLPTFGLFVTSFRPVQDIRGNGWWNFFTEPRVTLDNYRDVLFGGQDPFSQYVINSFVITIPSVVIPISIALLAAYAFAWIDFKGRHILFVAVFALQVVPIQITMIPLLTQYVRWDIAGSFWPVWLSHSIFALPLAIFLLHNFMRDIPPSLVEAARMDGAGHVTIFFRVMLPLLRPAIAAFAIFQFLWVWNDLLVALVFGSQADVSPLTVRLASLAGQRGETWHLLSAGAFVSMVVPVIIFLALQRYFVRGLLAGSVKG